MWSELALQNCTRNPPPDFGILIPRQGTCHSRCGSAKDFFFVITNESNRDYTKAQLRKVLTESVNRFVSACEANAKELHAFLLDFLRGHKPSKPATKDDVAQIVRSEAAPIRKTLAKVDATTTTINNRDKKYRRKSKARFSVEQQDGIYRQWMIAKQDTAVRALCEHKPGYEAAIIQFRKEFSAWNAHTAEDLKKALKARIARLSK